MTLRVYDTLRARKEDFQPVNPAAVGIYFCGMTVQDRPHIGHMLAFVAGDMIRRYLIFKGYKVTYIQNFTDIDDKIIVKAAEEGVDYRVIAERNMKEYYKYADELNIMRADIYPLATKHMVEIVSLIETLVAKGFAYDAGGDVYFRVRAFAPYGRLSKRNIDELVSGARIEVGERKEDPLDFALWKAAKDGEPAWDSPWGRGRPGWHIECSAMSMKYLGPTIDMHGGGQDLIFPHHENEIAQSEAATGKQFIRYWMHNGLLNLRGEKMSKSTGHFFAIEDINREFAGDVIRFYLLSTHFRSGTEFSRERLKEAEAGLERIRNVCLYLDERITALLGAPPRSKTGEAEKLEALVDEVMKDFTAAMDDDFNSAEAIGHVFHLVREVNRIRGEGEDSPVQEASVFEKIRDALGVFDSILGLFKDGLPKAGLGIPREVEDLVAERERARKEKNWTEADTLRKRIADLGFVVEDRPTGPFVKPAR
ncbi:MAG: cysteine--tRNA ligase [Candidatus Krumholzibacteria bacterium]|nr:cysteine--tRNA ligase [Candidatus Krumholzibacteria bacterium]